MDTANKRSSRSDILAPYQKGLSKISKQIQSIQQIAKEYSEESKQRSKYKKTCIYCQKYRRGKKDTKVKTENGEITIDLVKNGEGYCKLCETKFCNQYPNEEICNQISKLKVNKISSGISKLSPRSPKITKSRDPNCMKCLQKGKSLKKEGKLSEEDDVELKQSCLSCKKSTCLKDKILDQDDENFCILIDDIIKHYLSYKNK